LRGESRYFSVPVIALVPRAVDQAYVEAFSTGADDVVVRNDHGALTRRVAALSSFDPAKRHDPSRGTAVIAENRGDRRRLLGRLLRRSGFDVAFAQSGTELVSTITAIGDVRVLVLSEQLPPGGVMSVLHAARTATGNEKLPAVVLATGAPGRLVEQSAEATAVAIGSDLAPLDNLLFLANEVTRTDFSEMRKSARLLYATLCSFRKAGEMSLTHALVYNVSKDGLYVRTLDAPERGTKVWVELRPPRSTEAVHLRGTVMWALAVGAPALPAPPGFGLRLEPDECPPGDLARYVGAYQELCESPRLVG
jgi:CheY-like chemotaxis protein